MNHDQVLTVAQMRAAEQGLFDSGNTVDQLMKSAGEGAADWIWRIAAGRGVTVLCGPGNNGGDGYVIARSLRRRGLAVQVVAPIGPKTDAAKNARLAYDGETASSGSGVTGSVLVDCLFGSGLSRPLSAEHVLLLRDLAARHPVRIAVDLPSGVESDTGRLLNERLPRYDATLALGAWKFAHWELPAREKMGEKRLVEIGIRPVENAAFLVRRPALSAPAADSHKYRRGLAAVVAGSMPGAALLASEAAMRGGAGYVKLLSPHSHPAAPASLVIDDEFLPDALADERIDAVLVGPGLGRSDEAVERLRCTLSRTRPSVLDADALVQLEPGMLAEGAPILATPHDGELETLCRRFSVIAEGRQARARSLAKASGMVVLAKGPDTVIAAPDGRTALAPPAPSWLSVAGSGDVLAGIAVSRMANGLAPFEAACEAVWLHGRAAELCGPAFTSGELARSVSGAMAAAL